MGRHVLIAGASVAGPVLAFWLHRRGITATVVERAPSLRDGGQNVDVRGAGREVARRMGIEGSIRERTTGELGTRFVRADGTTVAEFPAGTSDTDGATASSRSCGVIWRGSSTSGPRRTPSTSSVTASPRFARRGNGIVATFASGRAQTFDLVVAADGIGSTTRRLVLGEESRIDSVGLYTAWLTVPRIASDDRWAQWFNAPGGRVVTLRPDTHGTTRAALSFLSPPRGYERLPPDDQHALLRERFRDAGWQAERVLAAFATASDMYFEHVAQVKAPMLSRGRGALVGDAGYCPSPISGMGTSLAFVGSYVLASELARHVDHGAAFERYERVLRPYVQKAQRLPPGAPRLALPRTATGIRLLHAALRVGASPLVARVGSLFAPPADAIDLPSYN